MQPNGRARVLTPDFPVLSAGPTPRTSIEQWSFEIRGEVDEARSWTTWEQFTALPTERITRDIHCVTKWSKLDTIWTGVSIDTLLEGVDTTAGYVLAFCDGGYATNLPVDDVRGGKAWVAYEFEDEPLQPEHGGPARLLVPHLYFWKSAKWVRGIELPHDKSSDTPATDLAARARRRGRHGQRTHEEHPARCPRLAAPLAGQHVDVRLTSDDGCQAQRSYSIASASARWLQVLARVDGLLEHRGAHTDPIDELARRVRVWKSLTPCSRMHSANFTALSRSVAFLLPPLLAPAALPVLPVLPFSARSVRTARADQGDHGKGGQRPQFSTHVCSARVTIALTPAPMPIVLSHRCILGSCVGSAYMGGQP
jgi:DMSO/TMAO reductase YedYZ molybdopterin-dependent catalytic subunit